MTPVGQELGLLARPDRPPWAAELEKELPADEPVSDRKHHAHNDHHEKWRCYRQKDGGHLHSGVGSRLHEVIGGRKGDAGNEGETKQAP